MIRFRKNNRGELTAGAFLLITSLLTFGYSASRYVHQRMESSRVEEAAAGLDALAQEARARARRLGSKGGADPVLDSDDPALGRAFEALARHYENEAARVRSGAREDIEEVRERVKPDPLRFVAGQLTGLPLDDLVFIAGDLSTATGSGNMGAVREEAAARINHPSSIRERVLTAAAGARMRDAYDALARENPDLRGLAFDDPRVLTLVTNRARQDIRNRYLSGRDEHLGAVERLASAIERNRTSGGGARPAEAAPRPASNILSGSISVTDPVGTRITADIRIDVGRGAFSGNLRLDFPSDMDIRRITGPLSGTYRGDGRSGALEGVCAMVTEGVDGNGRRISSRNSVRMSGNFDGRAATLHSPDNSFRVTIPVQ